MSSAYRDLVGSSARTASFAARAAYHGAAARLSFGARSDAHAEAAGSYAYRRDRAARMVRGNLRAIGRAFRGVSDASRV